MTDRDGVDSANSCSEGDAGAARETAARLQKPGFKTFFACLSSPQLPKMEAARWQT